MEIDVLYEDEFILALNKPCGLLVHGDGRSKGETLVDWLNKNYPDLSEVGEPQTLQNGEVIKRPGIVHRLDRDTSGVILVAKTGETHKFLKEQFQNRKVEKIYNAVVWGKFLPEKMEGVIDKPIGRSSSDFRKWSSDYGARGELREAVTGYKVLFQSSENNPLLPTGAVHSLDFSTKNLNESCKAPDIRFSPPYTKGETGGEFAYLEVRPKTGRTHQIRVHMKSISHPVVGDKLYGPTTSLKASRGKEKSISDNSESQLGFSRLALHALSIKLELPDGTHIKIESPLPSEFEAAKNLLKKG